MQQTSKVSVIMPSYNHGQFIAEAIQSVLDQTYVNWELIIIDNHSTDNTQQVVGQFADPRIQFIQFHNHGIIAASRNQGVRLCTGEVLAFLDSDDVWHPEKLAIQLPYLQEPAVAAVSTRFKPIGQTKYFNDHLRISNNQLFKRFVFEDMLVFNPVMTSSLIMRKEDFETLQGFDENSDFAFIEDYELWLRLMHECGALYVINQPLLSYRIVKNNRDLRKIKLNVFKIADKLQKMKYCTPLQQQQLRSSFYLSIANAHFQAGDRKAVSFYIKALFLQKGCNKKVKAILGILLSILPRKISLYYVETLYKLRAYPHCAKH